MGRVGSTNTNAFGRISRQEKNERDIHPYSGRISILKK